MASAPSAVFQTLGRHGGHGILVGPGRLAEKRLGIVPQLGNEPLVPDRVVLNRSDGAIIRLTSRVAPGESEEAVEARMDEFLSSLNPVLGDFIPSI